MCLVGLLSGRSTQFNGSTGVVVGSRAVEESVGGQAMADRRGAIWEVKLDEPTRDGGKYDSTHLGKMLFVRQINAQVTSRPQRNDVSATPTLRTQGGAGQQGLGGAVGAAGARAPGGVRVLPSGGIRLGWPSNTTG